MGGVVRRAAGTPLGLVPFLIPDWPNRADFARLVNAISDIGNAGWEIAIPAGAWSAATGATIATALGQVRLELEDVVQIARLLRPGIAVVYRPTILRLGRERLLDRLAGHFDQVMLEAQEEDDEAWIAACTSRGLGWVAVRSPAALDGEGAMRLADRLPAGASLYLALAGATGGVIDSLAPVAAAVAAVRALREDLVVAAGFGISTRYQVERLANVDGLDAVAIGTGLLSRLERSAEEAADYYAMLHDSAARGVCHAC